MEMYSMLISSNTISPIMYTTVIMEVQYFEESTNKKDDSLSLRFPVFLRWRFDKTEPSYN